MHASEIICQLCYLVISSSKDWILPLSDSLMCLSYFCWFLDTRQSCSSYGADISLIKEKKKILTRKLINCMFKILESRKIRYISLETEDTANYHK